MFICAGNDVVYYAVCCSFQLTIKVHNDGVLTRPMMRPETPDGPPPGVDGADGDNDSDPGVGPSIEEEPNGDVSYEDLGSLPSVITEAEDPGTEAAPKENISGHEETSESFRFGNILEQDLYLSDLSEDGGPDLLQAGRDLLQGLDATSSIFQCLPSDLLEEGEGGQAVLCV